jgi:hypothetical protein
MIVQSHTYHHGQTIASEVEGMPPEKKQFGMQLLIHLTKENQNPIREAKRNFSRHLICFEGLLPWCHMMTYSASMPEIENLR